MNSGAMWFAEAYLYTRMMVVVAIYLYLFVIRSGGPTHKLLNGSAREKGPVYVALAFFTSIIAIVAVGFYIAYIIGAVAELRNLA